MARAAKGAALRGLGRFLSTLAGGYAQDRQRREEEATSNRQFGQRVGEMTLRQYMEENSPSGQAALGKAQAEGRRLTAEAGQEEETLRRLQTGEPTVQQGIDRSKVDLGASELAAREKELAARNREIDAANAKSALEANTVKNADEWFARLPEWTASEQLEEAFQQVLRSQIGGNESVKLWIETKYTPWNKIQETAKQERKEKEEELGATRSERQAIDPSSMVSPLTKFRITPGDGAAATQDVGAAPPVQPPTAMGATPPAQLSSPSAAAENTAGLDEADIVAVREAAARWGVSFNDARARLESRVGTPR